MRQHHLLLAICTLMLAIACGDDPAPTATADAAAAETAGAADVAATADTGSEVGSADDLTDAPPPAADAGDAAETVDGIYPRIGPCADKPDGSPCDDGNPCTTDTCKQGLCVSGPNSCACGADGDCAAQEDGDLCNGTLYCDKSQPPFVCKVNPASPVKCEAPKDPCQSVACNPKTGKCDQTAMADGSPCDDGVTCTQGDICAAGVCKGGENTCCTSNADCAKFSGADLCAGSWFCNKATKKCQLNPVTVVVCPVVDNTACSKNTCDAKTGKCGMVAVADKTACNDGNPCTAGDACDKGKCAASANTCTCQSDADCANKDDGDLCNGVPFCNKATGTCAPNPATVVVCQTAGDGPCEVNTCQPATGKCTPVPLPDGATCEADGSKCTAGDSCKAGACIAATNTCLCGEDADCGLFEDGDLCNGTLYCDKVKNSCAINPKTVVGCSGAFNTPCSHNLCDPKTAQCAMAAVNAGKPCDDGNVCTEGDVCAAGQCKAGANTCKCTSDADCAAQEDGNLCNGTLFCNKTAAPYVCQVNPATVVSCPSVNDSFCQKNNCVPTTGKCLVAYLHNDEPCDDGTPCTVGEICKQGVCALPTLDLSKPCDDGNPCTDDSCNPKAGCINAPNAATCTDNDACTSDDGCKGGSCSGGKAVNCDDGNPCTTEVCNKIAGCVSFKNGELCDDGSACTSGDSCKAGACVAGAPKDCSDGKPCTLDSCDKVTGNCSSAAADAAKVCDDAVACTIESCDAVKGCVNTPSAGPCDDKVACTV